VEADAAPVPCDDALACDSESTLPVADVFEAAAVYGLLANTETEKAEATKIAATDRRLVVVFMVIPLND
jgi:hypothetical protein